MKYRLLFFFTEITLLVLVGLSSFKLLEAHQQAFAELGELFCPATNTGPLVFLLLILMNLVLLGLFFKPANDFFWWLNLVGLVALTAGVLGGFSPAHVLVTLSIGFGLAYRRVQGLRHIWHWRGLLVIGLGVAIGLMISVYGFSSEGVFSPGAILH